MYYVVETRDVEGEIAAVVYNICYGEVLCEDFARNGNATDKGGRRQNR